MRNKFFGVSSLLFASFIFSFYGVFARYISSDFGIFYQSASRYFVCVIIFGLLSLILGQNKKIKREDWKLLGLQAFFNFGVNTPFFLAVVNLPLGTALFLFYASSVIFSFGYGSLILKEKLSRRKILALIFALLGMIFIYHGSINLFKSVYILAGILAGGFYGLYSSSSKTVNLKYNTVQINLIEHSIVFLLTLPFIFLYQEKINLDLASFSWKINFLYALAVAATGYLVIHGFKYLEAQVRSLILLMELVFVVLVGYLFFREIPGPNVILGGILIIIALVIPNMKLKN